MTNTINPNEKYPIKLRDGSVWPIEMINENITAIVGGDIERLEQVNQ